MAGDDEQFGQNTHFDNISTNLPSNEFIQN